MEILFTGGSSFTGMWFCKKLSEAGYKLTIPLLHAKNSYIGTRKERVEMLSQFGDVVFECPFGSASFLSLIDSKPHWDTLCHHAADVTDYKNPNFDYAKALSSNTHNLKTILETLSEKRCKKVVLTGSVFEPGEGTGSDSLRAVSPYGLSKGLTATVFQYYCSLLNFSLGKFVIPNPFGPFEEERFTTFLIKTWCEKKVAAITHPSYIRDNIHVSLLAEAYCHFVKVMPEEGFHKINPSQYVETQGDFTKRFAEEMRKRLPLRCDIDILEQTEFLEPKVRYNTDKLDIAKYQWSEKDAWDELARYYTKKHLKTPTP